VSIPPTLLLADDSLTIQRVVALTFADQPVRIVVAKDGQDAINRMTRERPDLVLADTNMPCVDGYELARWVRDQPHLTAVPVLLLAGVTDPVDEQRLYDSGANGVLEKPFEPSHVISRVKELLGLNGPTPAPAGRLVTSSGVRPPPARKPAAGSPPARSHDRPAATPPKKEPALPPPLLMGSEAVASALDSFAESPAESTAPRAPSGDYVADRPAMAGEPRDPSSNGAAGNTAAATAPPAKPISSPADAFESLLAAEQGDGELPVLRPALESTPELLDALAARIVERLRPETTMLGAIRDAVNQGVASAVPLGIEQQIAPQVEHVLAPHLAGILRESVAREVREAVIPAIEAIIRDVVDGAVRGAIADAVRGDDGGPVRAVVRETAERLISEEIARIRQPRQ
jgi:CheY-like chemotaxis protein